MARLSAKLRSLAFDSNRERTGIAFWCPGCGESHAVCTSGDHAKGPVWQWNGDIDAPTLSPSILVRHRFRDRGEICHSFVRDGKIEFLDDSTHSMSGQAVPLPDWPSGGKEDSFYLTGPHDEV